MAWNFEYKNTQDEANANGMGSKGRADGPLTDSERQRILYDWNDTAASFPALCAHQLFEHQVDKTPDAIAVVFRKDQLTYRELNQRASQIAHYLRKLGVGSERLVGISLERSPQMIAGLLGIWKAGAAYVPLDPSYPQDRLSFMVQDAGVEVLLTEKRCHHLFSEARTKTVCLDSDWPLIAGEEKSNLDSGTTPSNLAYVMYTSGSTGTPKGAMILHSGLVNYLTWAIKTYGVGPGGSVPVHSSISFDLTVTSLYTPLFAGGQVELLPEDSAAQNLLAALRRTKGRCLVKITPAHLELLSQLLGPEEVAGMTKTFVIGGENLLADQLRLWRECAPATRLINEYGPTETVVGCCIYEVQADDPRGGSVPIGRPIANTQLYVLDPDLQPVPVGEMGELYIGGAGVARGYWNRPELTAERFLPDPFSGRAGGRLYKSGDLARYREDGILECLGRADNQVKVRGYRIELGEIEAKLASHPKVQSCAVLAREDEPGNRHLAAYVSSAKNQSPAPEELQSFLKQALPEYMVPTHFVFLETLPLTPNGKVDRKALPVPSHASAASGESVAPRTETEQTLAAIWTRLLKIDHIGIHEDFFDLGAHSLMAVRAVGQIREAFGVELPLATLLEAPTIAALAKILGDKQWVPSWSLLVPMRQEGTKPPLFLFHAHGGNVLEYHALVQHLEKDQPVYAFQAKGLDGQMPENPSVEGMAAAFLEELRQFQPQGPYFLGGFCLGGLLALEVAQQLKAAGQEVALVVLIQSMARDAMRFRPSISSLQRLWYRATKRISLEAENLSHGGKTYFFDRCRNTWDRSIARTAIAIDNIRGKRPKDRPAFSRLYIFEALGMEHKSAMEKYMPQQYDGDTLVLRASKQLRGLEADEYLGWRRIFEGAFDICEVPGHQQNLLLEPNVAQLAKEISSRLKAAQRRHAVNRKTIPPLPDPLPRLVVQ